jgi:hypothetical protein
VTARDGYSDVSVPRASIDGNAEDTEGDQRADHHQTNRKPEGHKSSIADCRLQIAELFRVADCGMLKYSSIDNVEIQEMNQHSAISGLHCSN